MHWKKPSAAAADAANGRKEVQSEAVPSKAQPSYAQPLRKDARAAGSRPQSNYGQAAKNNNQKAAEGNNERNNYNRVVAKARPVGSAIG